MGEDSENNNKEDGKALLSSDGENRSGVVNSSSHIFKILSNMTLSPVNTGTNSANAKSAKNINEAPSEHIKDNTNASQDDDKIEFLTKQIQALEKKHTELYKTIYEFQQISVDLKSQSNRTSKLARDAAANLMQSETRIQAYQDELNESKKNFNSEVDSFKNEIKESKNAILGMIALFASFFSFISVSINIFSKDLSVATSISLVLVLWICLISFIYVFMSSINSRVNIFSTKGMFEHFIVIAVSVGLVLFVPKLIFGEEGKGKSKDVKEKVSLVVPKIDI